MARGVCAVISGAAVMVGSAARIYPSSTSAVNICSPYSGHRPFSSCIKVSLLQPAIAISTLPSSDATVALIDVGSIAFKVSSSNCAPTFKTLR